MAFQRRISREAVKAVLADGKRSLNILMSALIQLPYGKNNGLAGDSCCRSISDDLTGELLERAEEAIA